MPPPLAPDSYEPLAASQCAGTRLDSVLEEIQEELVAAAGTAVAVRIDVEAGLPLVVAQPTQLELALLSLTVRARNTMRNGGTLAITASRTRHPPISNENQDPPAIRLSICDTGHGVSDASLWTLQERLRPRKAIYESNCKRLELVQRLVAAFGGAVTFASAPDVGARVDLWLPAADCAATTRPISQPEPD